MNKTFALILLIYPTSLLAENEIATCNTSLKGYEFYSQENKIENSQLGNFHVSVLQIKDESYDILYYDSTKKVKSAKAEGAYVGILELTENSLSAIVHYPSQQTDIYTFTKTKQQKTLALQTARNGKNARFPKNSLLIGKCE